MRLQPHNVGIFSDLIDRQKSTYAGTMQEQTAEAMTTTPAYRDPKRTLVGRQLHFLLSILVCIHVTSCLRNLSRNLALVGLFYDAAGFRT
jgi:hypothetical protein